MKGRDGALSSTRTRQLGTFLAVSLLFLGSTVPGRSAQGTAAEMILRGAENLHRGDAAAALRFFRDVPKGFVLHDWAGVYGARAASALKRSTEALDLLEAVVSRKAGGAWAAARDLQAELLEKTGRFAEAVEALDELRRLHPKHRHRWRWTCNQARCLVAAGRKEEGGRLFLEVCRKGPRRRPRREAFRRLAELWKLTKLPESLSVEERLAWAGLLREKDCKREGEAIVAELVSGRFGADGARQAKLVHARILWARKARPEAIRMMEHLARNKRADAETRAAAEELLADFDLSRNQVTHSAQRLDRLGRHSPETAAGARAPWKASDHWRRLGNWAAALNSCELLLKKHPKGFYAPYALLRGADCARRLGKAGRGEALLTRLIDGWPDHRLSSTARYMRILLRGEGKGKEIAAERNELARRAPLDLYALLAALDLMEIGEADGGIRARERVMTLLTAERPEFAGEGGWMALPPGVASWIRRRVEILREAGLWEAMVWELEERCHRQPRCFPLWNDLSVALARSGRFGDSIQVAESIDASASTMEGFSAAHHVRNRHPKAFEKIFRRHAKTHGIPVELAWAIAREESRFRPTISSWAGARGVMQIMPATGKWLFELRKWKNWRVERLWETETSVDMGCYYLARIARSLDELPAGEALTMAAYNGGPGNVKRWQKSFGTEPFPFFLERIPLQETRLYVKKVVRAMLHYELLWSDLERVETEGDKKLGDRP